MVVTHGKTHSKIYRVWWAMMCRCFTKSTTHYARYGGRGITVCEQWKKFENFYDDMGDMPSSKHTLDRINNDGNYEPSNCRWATRKEQGNNRNTCVYLTYNNEKMSITRWAEKLGISEVTLQTRIKKGWSVNDALSIPVRNKKEIEFNGRSMSIPKWADEIGVCGNTIRQRLRLGWSLDQTLKKESRVRPKK